MICLDMFNPEHQSRCTPMSPRISFSNDFVDPQQMIKHERISRSEPPVSSDFEFSVSNYNMMAADELIFNGRFLPFKNNSNNSNCTNQFQKMTLRDELLNDDDEDNNNVVSMRPPKGSSRWKELLRRKKTNIGSKKADKSEGSMSKGSVLVHEEAHLSKSSQVPLTDGESSFRDVENGM